MSSNFSMATTHLFKSIFLVLASCLTMLAGCATIQMPEELTGLTDIRGGSQIVLTERLEWIGPGRITQGLLPGTYAAVKQNHLGTFYQGSGRTMYMRGAQESRYMLQDGGFWLPKDATAPPRIFFALIPGVTYTEAVYVDRLPLFAAPNPTAAASADATSVGIAIQSTSNAPVQYSPGTVGAGAAIGGLIVGAIIESGRGQPQFLNGIDNAEIATKLREAAKASRGIRPAPG